MRNKIICHGLKDNDSSELFLYEGAEGTAMRIRQSLYFIFIDKKQLTNN